MRCLPMINKHKKFLTAAVFCAIASTGFVLTASAEETMTHDLDEVVVEADKDALPGSYVKTKGSIGILGEKSVLDVPFSNMNITQKTIETFGGPNQPLQSILANNRLCGFKARLYTMIFLSAASKATVPVPT